MQNAHVPVLGFAAFSGSGKTTLLAQLLPLLKKKNLRVALIKHSHHNFDIDKPGKDSYRLREAGASPVMLISKYRRAIITEFETEEIPRLDDQLKLLDQTALDLILVEGFKAESFPKIEIHRPTLNKPLLYPEDSYIIALATDSKISIPKNLALLDLNNPQSITDFIIHRLLEQSHD